MTPTYATLSFSSLADGLMAGLASRAHQWIAWDMLQIRSFDVEWGAEKPERIFVASSRLELRVFLPEGAPPVFSATSLDVSASHILTALLVEKQSLGAKQLLLATLPTPTPTLSSLSVGAKRFLRLQSLDQAPTQEDPFSQKLERWAALMPEKPSKIEDIRYRNSLGFVAHSIFNP
jgi:hypothetical protein